MTVQGGEGMTVAGITGIAKEAIATVPVLAARVRQVDFIVRKAAGVPMSVLHVATAEIVFPARAAKAGGIVVRRARRCLA